jgi:CelD/BcsL family acetyltransferase involved in cellulose biosynthesis
MDPEIVFRRELLPPIDEVEREWRSLETEATSFFVSWAWIGTMLDVIPAAKWPMLLRGRAGGETVALALLGAAGTSRRHGLIRSRGLYLNETGEPQFDAMMIEHNGILTTPEREPAALDALLAWFAEQRSGADELHLRGWSCRIPAMALASRGLLLSETAVPSYVVELDRLAAAGELDPILSANARQQMRRTFRHFAAQGAVHLREAASEAEAQRWFTGLKSLHCASWERRGRMHAFSRPFFERFHRRLIERCFDEDGIQLIEVRAGERVIGYLYNFRRGRRIYAYQSGFDDADARERPGYLVHALAIRHAFQCGMQIYDFMAGRNRLKDRFATRCVPMIWQVVQQKRLRFRLEHLSQRLKRSVQ